MSPDLLARNRSEPLPTQDFPPRPRLFRLVPLALPNQPGWLVQFPASQTPPLLLPNFLSMSLDPSLSQEVILEKSHYI